MDNPFGAMRRLHDRGPEARGLVVDREGVALGSACILVERTPTGYRRADPTSLAWLQCRIFDDNARLDRLGILLDGIRRALEAGELVKAQLLGLELPLEPLDDARLDRLAAAGTLMKAGFDPAQPRVAAGNGRTSGRWSKDSYVIPARAADDNPGQARWTLFSKEPELHRILFVPGNAVAVTTPDGKSIDDADSPTGKLMAPPKADYQAIYAAGQAIASKPAWRRYLAIFRDLTHFGTYDFQRDNRAGLYFKAYIHASNYAVGVYMAAPAIP